MNFQIFSLYWDNVDPEIVAAQKAVFDAMGAQINQHRINGFRHGEWMDWVMARQEATDVFLFIDIDCIPLSKDSLIAGVQKAAAGILFGAEGAANHLDPTKTYVGAWYAFVNRHIWHALGRPTALETERTDVAQLWAESWRDRGQPVEMIAPSACEEPRWDLPGRPKAYGIGTTYGEHCYHLFVAREGTRGLFLEKCREVAEKMGRAAAIR